MAESKIKRYRFENDTSYDKFEGDNDELYSLGLIYLITDYPNWSILDDNIWNSYFHHDSGTSIEIRKRKNESDLFILGLDDYIEKTKESLEKIFGELKEISI